jgi:SAM-dependent methyltransferase
LRELEFDLIRELFRYINYQINLPEGISGSNSIHLDLGCGAKPRNPFSAKTLHGTDFSIFGERVEKGVRFVSADLTKTLPFDSESFSSISAYDVLEHIPRWERLADGSIVFPFVNLMQEIYRILRPGGIFYAVTPGYPSNAAFQDPTHINFITLETLSYFAGDSTHADSLGYGFSGRFEVLHNSWLRGAGPYATKRIEVIGNIRNIGIDDLLRLSRRFFKLLRNRHPEHILWVLRKF